MCGVNANFQTATLPSLADILSHCKYKALKFTGWEITFIAVRGKRYENQKVYLLLTVFVGCFALIAPKGWTQPKPETKTPNITYASWWRATNPPVTETKPKPEPPFITHAFAVNKGGYGYIWKIYIEAEAGNAPMSRIAMVVDEPGFGHYPTDWLIIKPQYQKNLKGYIQWNTHSLSGGLPEWTQIILKVSIIDKVVNEGNVAVIPFTFERGVKDQYKYKLPPPFDQGSMQKLGYISIDLFPPGGMGYGSRS